MTTGLSVPIDYGNDWNRFCIKNEIVYGQDGEVTAVSNI